MYILWKKFIINNYKINLLTFFFNNFYINKITTRIYIGDASVYESVMLTSAMPASEVIKDLIRRRNIPDTPDWTLFELCNDFGVGKYIMYILIIYNLIIIIIII